MKPPCDVIVLGLGGMGSAALYHLARRGLRVCGVEQFGIAHELGSSHGSLRMIRKAYFEHPGYIPLVERAYTLWRELESESGAQLLTESGLILSGSPDCALVRGLESCYAHHAIPHERIDSAEAMRRYPQFRLPDDHVVYWDPVGGYVRVEASVETHVAMAQRFGAEVRIHEDVQTWRADDEGVTLTTTKGELHAAKLIMTAGAWTKAAFAELHVPLRVLRKVQLWYDSPNLADFRAGRMPGFYVDTTTGGFYGFPAVGEDGLKVAEHTGGEDVNDPDELDRALHRRDEEKVLAFLAETFPSFEPMRKRFSVCMYSMSNDEHFIIDIHPRYRNVVVAGGFSGHGFKFAPVVGEVLADLTIHGTTALPVEFLKIDRFEIGVGGPALA